MTLTTIHARRAPSFALALAAALLGAVLPAHAEQRDLGHEVLAPNDGWAAADGGTTGGRAATPDQTYVVTTRAELLAALNDGAPVAVSPANPSNAPKIVYVDGVIDANVDDANQPLACEDYFRPDPTSGELYSREAFLAAYDPAGPWGRANPTGPQERARVASAAAQSARVRFRIGSNTTLVGLGKHSGLRGAWLDVRGSGTTQPRRNVIIRNLTLEDTVDCFPQWSPTDGALGNWNAAYDSISLAFARNAWIDHVTFRDRTSADETQPVWFGRIHQVHDGLLDITNASDFVTVSWNRFLDHDKTMLIGSSDSGSSSTGGSDVGRLNTTLHHNLFDDIGQRAPRVRFGKVHVYDNFYRIVHQPGYGYSFGVGVQSRIVAEDNVFSTDGAVTPDFVIERFGTNASTTGRITTTGNLWNGMQPRHVVDFVAAWNAENAPDLSPVTDWTPAFVAHRTPAREVPAEVLAHAGPFNW
jgi:pectate lyase